VRAGEGVLADNGGLKVRVEHDLRQVAVVDIGNEERVGLGAVGGPAVADREGDVERGRLHLVPAVREVEDVDADGELRRDVCVLAGDVRQRELDTALGRDVVLEEVLREDVLGVLIDIPDGDVTGRRLAVDVVALDGRDDALLVGREADRADGVANTVRGVARLVCRNIAERAGDHLAAAVDDLVADNTGSDTGVGRAHERAGLVEGERAGEVAQAGNRVAQAGEKLRLGRVQREQAEVVGAGLCSSLEPSGEQHGEYIR